MSYLCFQTRRHAEFMALKKQIILHMEELDHIPETSFEKDVVCEDEDSFCLSRENITSLKLLICHVSLTFCLCHPAPMVIKKLNKQLHWKVVFFWSHSWRNVRQRTRPRVRVTERRSSSCGTGWRCRRRRGRPSMNTWSRPRGRTWKQWEDSSSSFFSRFYFYLLCFFVCSATLRSSASRRAQTAQHPLRHWGHSLWDGRALGEVLFQHRAETGFHTVLQRWVSLRLTFWPQSEQESLRLCFYSASSF